jgi:murein DD-endopeptidase MepM/ murein hydrolase activator NlpD
MLGQGLVKRLPRTASKALGFLCVAVLLQPAGVAGASRGPSKRQPARVQAKKIQPKPKVAVSKSKVKARVTARRSPTKAKRPAKSRIARRPARPERGSRGTVEEHIHVRRGDTLEGVLTTRGLSATEVYPWAVAGAQVYDLRALTPRRGITLRFDRATRALEAIRYEIDDHALLILESTPTGVRARREALPYFIEVKGVAGRVERGLREDALQAGVPPRVVASLADVFGWDVDVENGLRAGDEFRVLYENVWQTGLGRPEAGHMLGARLATRGRAVTAVYFEDADGVGGYYEPSGAPLTRSFLRYPVDFTEVTSEFSLLRRHPILDVGRPHLGVDFAAPAGTPVRAVAAGRVERAGWAGGLGQMVRIEHPKGLSSIYGHLSEIAPRIREGAAVTRGQVIGFVGATGLATGPHLHYALERDGAYLDPLRMTAEPEPAIEPSRRRAFDRVRTEVTQQLTELRQSDRPLTVSLSPPAYDED